MCGIAGFIGNSKKPKASYDLITNLFDNLEVRGTDASGFWTTEVSGKPTDSIPNKGGVVYHKMPVKSSEFIKTDYWQCLKKRKLNLIIVHARATSKGGGPASTNNNNHPFVTSDKRVALAHNGTLEEAVFLKDKYEILSNTDSEYLLRIYEAGLAKEYYTIEGVPNEVAQRVNGIKDIWSYVTQGAMAVAIGERIDDHSRGLFLFRNDKRPMWLADMRRNLGQIFFFSSPDIWYRALSGNDELKKLCWGSQKLMELPSHQIWHLRIDKEDTILTDENTFKLSVSVTSSGREFQKGDYCLVKKINPKLHDFPVAMSKDLEQLDAPEQPKMPLTIIRKEDTTTRTDMYATAYRGDNSMYPYQSEYEDCEREPMGEPIMDKDYHTAHCDEIKRVADDIANVAYNMIMEGSMTESKYGDLLESLQQTKTDLDATLHLLNG